MDEREVRELVAALDTADWGAQEETWQLLRGLGVAVVPYFLDAYPRMRFTEEQIVYALRQADAGVGIPELCRKYGISAATPPV